MFQSFSAEDPLFCHFRDHSLCFTKRFCASVRERSKTKHPFI